MKKQRIHNIHKLGYRRRELRNNPTSAEKYSWTCLKSSQLLGRKFRRQHGIGSYIADFYCASEKLIVELDGEIHNDPEQIIYDQRRDKFLKNLGFKIVRIKNELAFCNIPEVLRLVTMNFNCGGTLVKDPSVLQKAGQLPFAGELDTYT
jgi:very-short-patch-repair endonuclease